MPLSLLKLMGRSRRGVKIMEAQVRHPPRLESPHAVIDPSALMTAKADAVE
jgi:hypothetical protein